MSEDSKNEREDRQLYRRIKKDNANDKRETKLMDENEKWVVNECALKAKTDVSVCP